MAWNDLSMKEKAAYMKVAVANGITNLDDISNAYNSFAGGGPTETIKEDATDTFEGGSLPEVEITPTTRRDARRQARRNWFTQATLAAAMADRPEIMQASGWDYDANGNIYQGNPTAEGPTRLAEALEAVALAADLGPGLADALGNIGVKQALALKYKPDNVYRIINDEGFKDLVRSGKVRPKQGGPYSHSGVQGGTWFERGKASTREHPTKIGGPKSTRGVSYKGDYIIEVTPQHPQFPTKTTPGTQHLNYVLGDIEGLDAASDALQVYYKGTRLPKTAYIKADGGLISNLTTVQDVYAQGGPLNNTLLKPFSYEPIPAVRYDEGGNVAKLVNRTNQNSKANFVARLKDKNRKYITDWSNPNMIATHKMSWATDDKGNAIIYPEVQEINGELVDFTRPPYNRWAGFQSAIEMGDTIMTTPNIADEYTKTYKQYYPKGYTFDEGGATDTIIGPQLAQVDIVEPMSLETRALLNSRAKLETEIPYNNYLAAPDLPLWRRVLTKCTGKGGSNCTLDSTNNYGQDYTTGTARTIVDPTNPLNRFEEVTGENIVPGTLVIQSLPGVPDGYDNSYHTMIFDGISDRDYVNKFGDHVQVGDTLFNYSNGDSVKGSYRQRPKSATDNNHGKTYYRYFRPKK